MDLTLSLRRSFTRIEIRSRTRSPATSKPKCAASSVGTCARSTNPKPVEGATEVDIALQGSGYLILLEAKLGSDISPATKYDPARNQIVRNIDILLESAAGRFAAFWMIVRDTGRERAYVQLITEYRSNPGSLASLLPHRTAAEIDSVTRNLAIIHWNDILALIEREYGAVFGELWRRVVA